MAANNYYVVFGAATANMFRVMNNVPSIEWGMDKDIDYNVELHATNGRELNLNKRLCLIIRPLSITHFQIRCRYTSCNSFVRVYQKNALVSHADRQRTHPI